MLTAISDTAIADALETIFQRHADIQGPLLPILHDLQGQFGHVPQGAVQPIADHLNISKAEVHGVISFYHDFRDLPAGHHTVKICRAEACQAMGANQLADAAQARLGVSWHGTTANGAVTLEPVYCLGLCACGPAAMIDDKLVGRVDETRLNELLTEAGA